MTSHVLLDEEQWTPYASLQAETREYEPTSCMGHRSTGESCRLKIASEAFHKRQRLLEGVQSQGPAEALEVLAEITHSSLCSIHKKDFSKKLKEWKIPFLEMLVEAQRGEIETQKGRIATLEDENKVFWEKGALPEGTEAVSSASVAELNFHLGNMAILIHDNQYSNWVQEFVNALPNTYAKGLSDTVRVCSEAFFLTWLKRVTGGPAVKKEPE